MSDFADVKIDEKIKVVTREPGKYKVVMLNDDKTPMEFVMEVLMHIYKHNSVEAEEVTMSIHTEGAGIAGVYPFDIAEQKSKETLSLSKEHGFPLKVKVEKA
jgi:ATP-dependent Clp protease adaptor protein ClpS